MATESPSSSLRGAFGPEFNLQILVPESFHSDDFGGPGRRTLATIVDFSPFFLIWSILGPSTIIQAFRHQSVIGFLALEVPIVLLYVFMLYRVGGTPGKLLLGLRVVDQHGAFLSLWRAFVRSYFYPLRLAALVVHGWYAVTLMNSYASRGWPSKFEERHYEYLMNSYTSIDNPFSFLVLGAVLVFALESFFFAATDDQQRAGHDYLAGSYVLKTKAIRRVTQDSETFRGA